MAVQNTLRVRSGAADEGQNLPSELTSDLRGEGGVLAQALAARRSRNRRSARIKPKMFLWRAFWYFVAFFVCYSTNVVGECIMFEKSE